MIRGVPDIAALPADLREGLDRLAAAVADQPFGPPPLAKLVETHFVVFAELRQRGAQWAQIAVLLETCGIAGDDGAFCEAVVRATYARVAKARRAASGGDRRNAAKHSAIERNAARHSAAADAAAKRSATKRGATTRTAAKHDGANRDAAERNDVKPGDAAGEALARRFSLIDRPWHTR